MAAFLDIERAEIYIKKEVLGEADFRDWYNSSIIKGRHKKACIGAQGLRCCYCHKFFELPYNNIWDLEHILAAEHYPQFFAAEGNLAVACKRCNIAKSDTDVLSPQATFPLIELPDSAADYIIPHPLLTDWNAHLTHSGFMVYRGKTPEGINLVNICKLNAPVLETVDMTIEMVEASIVTKFFDSLSPIIPVDLPASVVIAYNNALLVANENLRRDLVLAKLNSALARTERAMRRRAAEQEKREEFHSAV